MWLPFNTINSKYAIKRKLGWGASNPLSSVTYQSGNYTYMSIKGRNILHNKHKKYCPSYTQSHRIIPQNICLPQSLMNLFNI